MTLLFLCVLTASAQPSGLSTLQALLISYDVPLTSFSRQDLSAGVQGLGSREQARTIIAFQLIGENQLLGHLAVLAYTKSDGKLLRASPALLPDGDLCTGAVDGLDSIGGYSLLSMSVSPSANCVFVLDCALHRVATLYGFNMVEVVPGSVIVEEDTIHFAPVHPERLQTAELSTGKTLELYPAKGDLLRARFAAEHARHMPPVETCRRMNDPCQSEVFDEDIADLVSDGKGTFAFLAHQSASHALAENTPPETVGSQTVLYVYRLDDHPRAGKWKYCEKRVQPGELIELGQPTPRLSLAQAVAQCSPTLTVVPDLSTASYNPFLRQ